MPPCKPSSAASASSRAPIRGEKRTKNVIFIHPDLGIGGAERLVIDAALALQARGHSVTVYTSYRDRAHCFDEARDGTLDVRVRGNTLFPAQIGGRFHVLMAILRQLHLTLSVIREGKSGWSEDFLGSEDSRALVKRERTKARDADTETEVDDVYFIDQVPTCVPILKLFGAAASFPVPTKKQRILFYAHFPDQLLARRDEGNLLTRILKTWYRYPFDWLESWTVSASDVVVANSNFSRGVSESVFGEGIGEVKVVYPCVDTSEKVKKADGTTGQDQEQLWGGLKILLSINRFERKKDIGLAIKAYHGLGEQGRQGTKLVLAGGYDNRVQENVQYHRELDQLATGLGLKTATSKTVISALSVPDSVDVLFLLSVPTAFKETLLASAELLLYTPSHEHFGIVPVEAMHAGLPVLAANTGGPLETIAEGRTGWLRDVGAVDQWTAVMRQVLWEMPPGELAAMGARGRDRVQEKFSLAAMGERLEEEIDGMLEKAPRPIRGVQPIVLASGVIGLLLAVVLAALVRALY